MSTHKIQYSRNARPLAPPMRFEPAEFAMTQTIVSDDRLHHGEPSQDGSIVEVSSGLVVDAE